MKPYDPRITSTVALVALTVWIGGLLTMGAVVAPIAFAALPYSYAADTMPLIFARFDKVAMAAAAVVVATEALRAGSGAPMTRASVARLGLTVVLAGLAVTEGLWLTPTISRLHAAGALRGVGEAGAQLASTHKLAELAGKAQALLAVVVIALHVTTLERPGGATPAALSA